MAQDVVSPEFQAAVEAALQYVRNSPDGAVAYMADSIQIYMQPAPTREQAVAGGCPNCTFLGLWANRWQGYPPGKHGTIWLFERGIRSRGGDLAHQTVAVLLHEMDHALNRDHVLEALGRQKAAAAAMSAPRYRCCGR